MSSTTRTPEGWDGHCEICRTDVVLEASPSGDATCPQCGALVWLKKPKRFPSQASLGPLFSEAVAKKLARRIRSLVGEIKLQCQLADPEHVFWAHTLPLLTNVLSAFGARVWTWEDPMLLPIASYGDVSDFQSANGDVRQQQELLGQVIARNESQRITPNSIANDWPNTLHLYALVRGPAFDGVRIVGISQRAEAPAATQRGYLRFLTEMCDFIGSKRVPYWCERYPLPPLLFPQGPPTKPPKPKPLTESPAGKFEWLQRSFVGRLVVRVCKWLVLGHG